MIFYPIRLKDGTIDPASSGMIVYPNGDIIHLSVSEFSITALRTWQSKSSGVVYPSGWEINVPEHDIQLYVQPTLKNQVLITGIATYWEGSCLITGKYKKEKVSGRGYTVLTGYDKR